MNTGKRVVRARRPAGLFRSFFGIRGPIEERAYATYAYMWAHPDEFPVRSFELSNRIRKCPSCAFEGPVRVKKVEKAVYYTDFDVGSLLEAIDQCDKCLQLFDASKEIQVHVDSI